MHDILVMAFKLLLAGLLGGFVGYEREVHEHPAGLRTHILVCMGAAVFTLVSLSFGPGISDPARIAAQIVSGIGFLGAGAILRQGNIVRGLTTAASLWTVAAIGMAVGIGGPTYYALATFATGIVFITLSTVRGIEPSIGKRKFCKVTLDIPEEKFQILVEVIQHLTSIGVTVQNLAGTESREGMRTFTLGLNLPRGVRVESIVNIISKYPGLGRFECV
jgi:putative Mg2+ transporter-C (MgtC) family protein